MSFTCVNCNVKFQTNDIQREHYKTDWHRYNLKRRVAELPPVTAEDFKIRVIHQRILDGEDNTSLYCNACRKHFSSKNAHNNHLSSKKHKDNLVEFNKQNVDGKEVTVMSSSPSGRDDSKFKQQLQEDDEVEEVDSDEWNDDTENPIANNQCIFCDNISTDFVENMKHMSLAHSFFVPDVEYCTNLEGLMLYLAEKVANDFICLWCNDRGKTFYSLDAVRKHMTDKGHCKMIHEGVALAEYADFYDYSSSYPDHDESMDIDEELEPALLDGDEYQLVLPSGAVIGHRSLMRYYKQRLNPNRVLTVSKSDRKLHKVLSEYRSLGWTGSQQDAAARRARDIHLMKRVQAKWMMKLGVRANKLQRHFRRQVDF